MRIGLDLRMANLDYGIGRYSFELARHIIEADRANSYFLFVRDPKPFIRAGFAIHKNVEIIEADIRHYSFGEQTKFYNLLLAYRLDLVHFLNFNVPIFYNGKFVVTIHDVVHHKLPGNKPSRFMHRMAYRYVIKNAARKAAKIITVSNFSKKDIAETLNINPDKIQVIYEAATVVPVSESECIATRQIYGITRPYIIFVGVMERKKNIIALAKAFDILKGDLQQSIELVMVGKEDSYYPEVMREARSITYARDLIFTGVVSDKDKFALVKGAEAFVSASLYEGFGLPGLEAMSIGVPLVVSNTEVFNEVYDNGAIYFDQNDPKDIAEKISLILNDNKYRQLVADNAYARAQLFSWEKAARETIQLYQSV